MFELFFCAANENEQNNQLSKEEFTSQLGQVCMQEVKDSFLIWEFKLEDYFIQAAQVSIISIFDFQFYLSWARSILGTDSGRNISEIFDAMDQDNDEQISVDEVVDYYKNLPNTRDSVAHFANAMANKDFSTEGKFELHFFGC